MTSAPYCLSEGSFPSQYLPCEIETLFLAFETIWFRRIDVYIFFLIRKKPKPTNQIKQQTLVKSSGGLFKILITQGLWARPLAGVRYRAVWICSMADYQCLQQPHWEPSPVVCIRFCKSFFLQGYNLRLLNDQINLIYYYIAKITPVPTFLNPSLALLLHNRDIQTATSSESWSSSGLILPQ